MSLGDLVSLVIVAAIVVFVYWIWLGPTMYQPFKNFGLNKFHSFLSGLSLQSEEYEYFTTGHIIWSRTSISEIEERIRNMAVRPSGIPGPAPAVPRFLLYADEENVRIYFIPTEEKYFDWRSIPHYEEYLKEQVSDS